MDGTSWLPEPGTTRHTALLYRDEAFLMKSVMAFITSGLSTDAMVFVLMTRDHLEHIYTALDSQELQNKRLSLLEADDYLAGFMVDGQPNEALFMRTMETLMVSGRHGGRIRVFGEMVTVLCHEGKAGAAIRLEELWHLFIKRYGLDLMCTYPLSVMYGEGGDQIRPMVCRVHEPVQIKANFGSGSR